MPRKCVVGICLGEVKDIRGALSESREAGFDYLCANIVSEGHRSQCLEGLEMDGTVPFSWFDMSLGSPDWCQSVVGGLSDVHPLTESPTKELRDRACGLLEKELGYSQHLSMHSTMLSLPQGESPNLARLLNSKLCNDGGGHSNMSVWVRLPLLWPSPQHQSSVPNGDMRNGELSEEDPDEEGQRSSWPAWNRFRFAVSSERRFQPVLELPLDLPSDPEEIARWLGEPVRALVLHETHFTSNAKGFPVLPRALQRVLKDFVDIGAHVILQCGAGKRPEDYVHFKQYVEFLYNQTVATWDSDPLLKFTKGYEDYLQSPLQPLMDNLEANTYEVFERDPTKYQLYERAIEQALLAKVPDELKDEKEVVCMVVGAGRGPLVRNCLNAAGNVGRRVRVYAVEKNVNAVCTLLYLKKEVWRDRVTVISSDMREWTAVEKADIMISELLGSFGDNELSPECLDGAQNFLKEDGIMIPRNYTSFLSPVMTPKLHYDVRNFADPNKHQYAHFETPFVVYMKNFYEIDKPQRLFHFEHPKLDNSDNDRFARLTFQAKVDCVMHGFAGYFESQLFNDVLMSIHPATQSDGMFSWFPIYFPIREPLPVRKGDRIQVNFWRCSNKHTVWYEWAIQEPGLPTNIHNANGRSYTIGL